MPWAPTLRGVIDRRLLVNFRIDPDVLAGVLPEGFCPRTVDGADGEWAIGACEGLSVVERDRLPVGHWPIREFLRGCARADSG